MVNCKIGDALARGIALLNENSIETAALDARVLLCYVLSCDKLYLTVHKNDDMPTDKEKEYFKLLNRRAANEPIGYIVGKKEFMSLDFFVTPGVLIPRPDTEILVERVIKECAGAACVIVDMCTGSGAIAVSLAKYIPDAQVTGLDISSDALDIAKKNALHNGVEAEFKYHNVLEPFCGAMADAVVSNPPYIPDRVVDTLESDVLDFEPRIALAGGDDGLVFYRAIVGNISSCLKSGGLLAFEVGWDQAEDVMEIMRPFFRDINTDCDLAGIRRVVYGFLK